MSTVSLTKPEILARLLEIHAARKAFDVEEGELLARLQQSTRNTARPTELTFGKNTITWGDGQVLYIKGKGYKFVKALYETDKDWLKVEQLGLLVWENELVSHNTFTVMLHRLSEKLASVGFPYRLVPKKSKIRVELTGEVRGNKPVKKLIQPEIIGAGLGLTVNCQNVRGDL